MNSRVFVCLLLVWSLRLTGPSDASACTCFGGIATIESQVAHAPLVIGARVVAAEPLKDSAGQVTKDVAAIRVEVLDVLRGDKTLKELRIWDQFVGSSCSLELSRLPVGTLAIIALNPKEERLPEFWELIGIKPEPSDYLLGTCRQHWRIFKTELELRRFATGRSK